MGVLRSSSKTNAKCPRCGRSGQPVSTKTLKHQVRREYLQTVKIGSFRFCRNAACDVVYFSDAGVVLSKADVRERVALKEADGTISLCYCFGFSRAMMEKEVRSTGRCTIPQRIAAQVKAGNCACEIRNPQGTCCLGNVTAALKRITGEHPHAPSGITAT